MGERVGQDLNQQWQVGARHALYREDGRWFHQLTKFPGALFEHTGTSCFRQSRLIATAVTLASGRTSMSPTQEAFQPFQDMFGSSRLLPNPSSKRTREKPRAA